MPELISQRTVHARKPHWCYDCREVIPIGTRHVVQAIKYDGFYSLRSHDDCAAMSAEIVGNGYQSDYEDGVPPLVEMVHDSGEFEQMCADFRGFYPHVICRLELRAQHIAAL